MPPFHATSARQLRSQKLLLDRAKRELDGSTQPTQCTQPGDVSQAEPGLISQTKPGLLYPSRPVPRTGILPPPSRESPPATSSQDRVRSPRRKILKHESSIPSYYMQTPDRKSMAPREYKFDDGFLLTPRVSEADIKSPVIRNILRARSSTCGFDDPISSNAMVPVEPEVELTMDDLSVYTSLIINVSAETPLRLLAHLSRGATSIPLSSVDCVMENTIADQAERYRKLLEQQKWIEKVLKMFNGYVSGTQKKQWVLGMADLSRKLRNGSIESFVIVAHNMTFQVQREYAIADPTSAHFRSKLEQSNIPFNRSGLDEVCEKHDEDDRLLLQHINEAKRTGNPYTEAVMFNKGDPGVEQLKPLDFSGQRAIIGLLDFLRDYYLDKPQIPKIIAGSSFSGATQEFYRIEKLSECEDQRFLIHLEGNFLPHQIVALCDLLEEWGQFSIGLSGGIDRSNPLPKSITFMHGKRKIT